MYFDYVILCTPTYFKLQLNIFIYTLKLLNCALTVREECYSQCVCIANHVDCL